ncbi:cleavage stimulation factor subunit 3-like [Halichondria panicea]|uniref:cleavage stimulation factor subunit 3-like n=1 Tax=Halichondria panicea TaxID=6063 RepID=UPI00312B3895
MAAMSPHIPGRGLQSPVGGDGPGVFQQGWSFTEHGKKAEVKLVNNPYDLEAWSVLVREAQSAAMIRARILYERLVSHFPTSGRYWRLYVEQEMRHHNHEHVEKLFQRSLMSVLHIDLWKCYISYVKDTKASLPSYREKLRQTYEFALDHVGIDYHSTSIWTDYITFLKNEDAQGTFAENQKSQALRKAYQRAVVTPLANLEQMWKEYNFFENTDNKMNAKRNIDTVSRHYLNAKRSAQEYDGIARGLIRGSTSVPMRGTPQESQQLLIWKRIINWERSNPTRTEDHAILVKRVLYSYEQCLLCFGHCADIWYEAALYLQRASEAGVGQHSARWAEEAAVIYNRAITGPLKDSLLLHFAYADFEEARSKFEGSEAIYNKLVEKRTIDPTLVYIQYMKFSQRTAGIKVARQIFKRAREDERIGHQVFVAAALMEYFINKDKTVAYRIFDLGLKSFGDEPQYILSFLDHLSHLTEDNNTRVLFEKSLSSMSPDKTSEIWEKFVEFESTVGDLASVINVEKRRTAALKNDDVRSKDTVMLVDRYKFLGLMPCSEVELKLIGHPSCLVSQSSGGGNQTTKRLEGGVGGGASGSGGGSLVMELREAAISKPDLQQMLPFKPSSVSGVGMNAVPGGCFPLPSELSNLLSRLPPPDCFHGPFVQLNELMALLDTSDGSEVIGRSGKRKRDGGEESDDDGSGGAPPINDIYRSRQQKRVHNIV